MKPLKIFFDKNEAVIAEQYLKSNGIHVEISGAKEYASHITGTSYGQYELRVDSEQFEQAKELLSRVNNLNVADEIVVTPESYLKKAVIYALFAILMFPIVFNYFSILNTKKYFTNQKNVNKKIFFTFLVALLQIPSLVVLYFIFEAYFK